MDLGGAIQGGVSDPRYVKREVDLSYSKEEARVNDALVSAMAVPSELFRVKGFAEFVPRHGFMKREPGVMDVLGTGRNPGPDRRMDYSGSYGSFSGTSRPGLGMV